MLAFAPIVVMRAGVLAESDTFWQIRAGHDIWSQRALPTVDAYSWTMAGKPWQSHSWAFNLLLALADTAAGLPGVAVLCAVLTTAAAACVLALMRRLHVQPFVAGVAIVGSTPLVIGWYSARPQAIDYIAVPLLLLCLDRLPTTNRPVRALAVLATLVVVWVNLHEAALLAVGITGAVTLTRILFRAPRAHVLPTVVAVPITIAAAACNPWGLSVLFRAGDVARASTGIIVEWQRPDLTDPSTAVALLLCGVALWRAWSRRDPVYVGSLTTLLLGSLAAQRLLPIAVLVALPILVAGPYPRLAAYARSRRSILVAGLLVGESVFAIAAAPSLAHIGRPDPATYSPRMAAAIPSGCRVFNAYLLGGYVILERPDVTVSVDSRNDLYGVDQVLANARAISRGALGDASLAGADCALIPPASPLATAMRGSREWHLVTEDATAALFTRA